MQFYLGINNTSVDGGQLSTLKSLQFLQYLSQNYSNELFPIYDQIKSLMEEVKLANTTLIPEYITLMDTVLKFIMFD